MCFNYKAVVLLIITALIAANVCIGQVRVILSSRQSSNIGVLYSNLYAELYLVTEEDTVLASKVNDTTFLLDLQSISMLNSQGEKYFNIRGANFCAFVSIEFQEINSFKLIEIRLFRKKKNRTAVVSYCQQECVNIFYPKVVNYKSRCR